MRKPFAVVAFALSVPCIVDAQADTTSRGEVFGTVYDSVARAPVAGAIVQLVFAAKPEMAVFSATTDSRGRYSIAGIPPGRYVGGFDHIALDSLGLDAPLRLVDVRAGERNAFNLAVPSPSTIVRQACGQSGKADSTGLLIGLLRDARTGNPLTQGTVNAHWQEFVLDSSGFHQLAKGATAVAGPSGWFALCGIPGLVDVAIVSWVGGDTTGAVAVSVPVDGLRRHDLSLGGTAVVRGVVVSDRKRPIPNAHVEVAGRERGALTDSAGGFRLGDIPAGSQTLDVRALGYARIDMPVVLRAGTDTTVAFTLTSVGHLLDTMRVFGRRVYNRDSNGFGRRKRMGLGYFLDQETVQRLHPTDVIQLMYHVPSLRIIHGAFERRIMMRGTTGPCEPELYIDGMRLPNDFLRDLDMVVRPAEIDGIEVYTAGQAPPQFTSFRGCGTILIWTRAPVRPAK